MSKKTTKKRLNKVRPLPKNHWARQLGPMITFTRPSEETIEKENPKNEKKERK